MKLAYKPVRKPRVAVIPDEPVYSIPDPPPVGDILDKISESLAENEVKT